MINTIISWRLTRLIGACLLFSQMAHATQAAASEQKPSLEKEYASFLAQHWQAAMSGPNASVKAAYYQKEASFWDSYLWNRNTTETIKAQQYLQAVEAHACAAKLCSDEINQQTHLFVAARYMCDSLMANFFGEYDWENIRPSAEYELMKQNFADENPSKAVIVNTLLVRHVTDVEAAAVYLIEIKKNLRDLHVNELTYNYFLWEHVYKKMYWQGSEPLKDLAFEGLRACENIWLPLAGSHMVEKCQQLIWECRSMAKRKSNFMRSQQLLKRARNLESLLVELNKAELIPHDEVDERPRSLGSIDEEKGNG